MELIGTQIFSILCLGSFFNWPNIALNRSAVTMRFYFSAFRAPRPVSFTLARQAKLDASCRVKVPVGQGLANRPYRVLRVRRSVASGFDCCKCEQGRRSVHREPHRPQGIRTSLKPGQHRYSINAVGDVVNVTEANTKKSPRRDF